MPSLTRWFIKSALVYLVASLLIGVVLAADTLAALSTLMPTYLHLFMVGWVTQMIFGVAYWVFPRRANAELPGCERLVLLSYLALNAGLIGRAVAEPMLLFRPGRLWAGMLIVSALFQWLATLAFAANMWTRVKER